MISLTLSEPSWRPSGDRIRGRASRGRGEGQTASDLWPVLGCTLYLESSAELQSSKGALACPCCTFMSQATCKQVPTQGLVTSFQLHTVFTCLCCAGSAQGPHFLHWLSQTVGGCVHDNDPEARQESDVPLTPAEDNDIEFGVDSGSRAF